MVKIVFLIKPKINQNKPVYWINFGFIQKKIDFDNNFILFGFVSSRQINKRQKLDAKLINVKKKFE